MNNRAKFLLGVSFSLVATPALAAPTDNIAVNGAPVAVDNGGTVCNAIDGDGNAINDG